MAKGRTRREFLWTAGTGVAAGLLAPSLSRAQGGAPPAVLRTRKNVVSSAAASDLASLKKGVAAMKDLIKTSPNDPRGWFLQAFIHGNCSVFTKCQHNNWFFAPWHRSFLYYFEQLIQQFSGDNGFALPYWDWSRTTSVPAAFYGPQPPPKNCNPYDASYDPRSCNALDDTVSLVGRCANAPSAGRGRGPQDKFSQRDLDTYVGPAVINRIQSNADYATYGGTSFGGGELEGTPHNFVHGWVGGFKGSNMVRAYSPLDPIFWMHHCNIDRLYSNWLSRPNHNPPDPKKFPEWHKTSWNDFFDRNGKPAGSEFTAGATVDSRVMGYVYDVTLGLPKAAVAAAAPATKTEEVVGSLAASKATVQDRVLSFETDAAPPAPVRLRMNMAAVGVEDHVVRLRIEGIKTPKQQRTGVHVFIGPGITADTPITAPGYVGSFTFFEGDGEGEGGDAHQHGPKTRLLSASDALQRLYGDTSVPEGAKLSVSIVTRPLFDGVGDFAQVEEIRPDKIQLDVVDLDA